jgi:hypothetical protein
MILCVIHGISRIMSHGSDRAIKRLWTIFPATNEPSIGMEKNAMEHLHDTAVSRFFSASHMCHDDVTARRTLVTLM